MTLGRSSTRGPYAPDGAVCRSCRSVRHRSISYPGVCRRPCPSVKQNRQRVGPGLRQLTSSLHKTGENVALQVITSISFKRTWIRVIPKPKPNWNDVTIYPGLTPGQLSRLDSMSKRTGKTQSELIRGALDLYFARVDQLGLPEAAFRKPPRLGLVTASRTIRVDQNERLRQLTQQRGRQMSELVRVTCPHYLYHFQC